MHPHPAEMTYPESDGQPMSDNTLQAFWIIFLYNNLNALLPDFVAANLLWYPVRGNRKALAPDVLVALGRPKGYRGSYLTWNEAGIQPQIVFEIRSPSNTDAEMSAKRADYDRFGVEEYYHYDPHHNLLEVFVRQNRVLERMAVVGSFDSPLLGIRFLLRPEGLQVLEPNGRPFQRFEEERAQREAAEALAEAAAAQLEAAEAQIEAAAAQIEAAEAQAAQERQRAERLLARLRALGLDEDL
jgi:Uma2 family endonuclease